jgi:hypothetical protein
VRVLCPGANPDSIRTCEEALRLIARDGTDRLGFLQFFHLHRSSAAVLRAAAGARLAGVAAQLLGARRVRLFQDAGEPMRRLGRNGAAPGMYGSWCERVRGTVSCGCAGITTSATMLHCLWGPCISLRVPAAFARPAFLFVAVWLLPRSRYAPLFLGQSFTRSQALTSQTGTAM